MRTLYRLLLFLLLCIPVRALFIYGAYVFYNVPGTWTEGQDSSYHLVKILIVLAAFLIGAVFIYRHWKRQEGTLVNNGAFGEKAYWNGYAHGLLYLVFAIAFAAEWKGAWVFLALDLALGVAETASRYWIVHKDEEAGVRVRYDQPKAAVARHKARKVRK
jgi:O-antigen/teichoic acid export membrane protein